MTKSDYRPYTFELLSSTWFPWAHDTIHLKYEQKPVAGFTVPSEQVPAIVEAANTAWTEGYKACFAEHQCPVIPEDIALTPPQVKYTAVAGGPLDPRLLAVLFAPNDQGLYRRINVYRYEDLTQLTVSIRGIYASFIVWIVIPTEEERTLLSRCVK